jgi:hypothetical protein
MLWRLKIGAKLEIENMWVAFWCLTSHNSVSILRGSWALWGGAGSGWKGLGFSLCAVPSRLAGPRILELGVDLSQYGGLGRGWG